MTATPTPRRLYVHDDLTECAWSLSQARATAVPLVAELLDTIRREPHVALLTLAEQLDGLLRRGGHPPFRLAIGIGAAGEAVARAVDARAGWFPEIVRVEMRREEDGRGGYVLATPAPIARQLADVPDGAIAVVDDTLFSGITLRAVLEALPRDARRRARVFCLRAVAESIPAIEALCPVTVGVAAPGRILHDVSFINASGLVRRGAIRRAGAPPLAFFERPEWMRAWFPTQVDAVTRLCRRLHPLLDRPPVVPAGATAV